MNLVFVILTLERSEGEESLLAKQKRSFTSFRACTERSRSDDKMYAIEKLKNQFHNHTTFSVSGVERVRFVQQGVVGG
jgi:hypothetical protein